MLLSLASLLLAAAIARAEPMRGMYIVSGAFIRGWEAGLGVPFVLSTQDKLEATMARSLADIKRLGFNTVIVDSGFYAGENVNFDDYALIILRQAARDGLGVVLGLPVTCPPAAPDCLSTPVKANQADLSSCIDGAGQRAFVDRFAGQPGLAGFDCVFENMTRPEVTPQVRASMHALTLYIQSKGKFYIEVPSAGAQNPAVGVFSLVTPEMNPKLFPTPAAMFTEVSNDAAREGGAEISLWHAQTIPQFGYPSGPAGTQKWHQLQYDAFVRVRPRNVTVFDYQKVIATQDGRLQFYTPRGWLMSLMARLDDPSLTFYDPLESLFSSMVMHVQPSGVHYLDDGLDALLGHGVDGGTAAIAKDGALRVPLAIASQGGKPLVSPQAGTFSAWVKAAWPIGSAEEHGLLQVPCLAPGRNCVQLRIAAGKLELALRDGEGTQKSVAAALAGGWRMSAWNQVAATWDLAAGQLALYLNGRKIGAAQAAWAATAAPAAPATGEVTIGNLGAAAGAGDNGLDGELDEVRLYSRALPSDQIARLYGALAGARLQ